MKLAGDLFEKDKSLWANWVIVNKLLSKYFWEVECKMSDTPIRRSKVFNAFSFKIGDDKGALFFYDP